MRIRVARIFVRVELQAQRAVAALDVLRAGVVLHAKYAEPHRRRIYSGSGTSIKEENRLVVKVHRADQTNTAISDPNAMTKITE